MRAWARVVPQVKIFGVSINPGPFSIKEHVIITIMANVGSGSAYAVSSTFYALSRAVKLIADFLSDGHRCCTACLLQSEPFICVFMAARHVHSAGQFFILHVSLRRRNSNRYFISSDWFLHWWYCSSLFGAAPVHDLAHQSGHLHTVQHPPFAAVRRYRYPRRCLP